MGGGDEVRQLVEALARARVADDVASFASYLTPQALLQLGGNGAGAARLPRPRRFDVIDVAPHGDAVVAVVRFGGRGLSYNLRTTWQRIDAVWKAVDASIPSGSVRVAWWRRLLGSGAVTADQPARRDLS